MLNPATLVFTGFVLGWHGSCRSLGRPSFPMRMGPRSMSTRSGVTAWFLFLKGKPATGDRSGLLGDQFGEVGGPLGPCWSTAGPRW